MINARFSLKTMNTEETKGFESKNSKHRDKTTYISFNLEAVMIHINESNRKSHDVVMAEVKSIEDD